jgi:hypothetical protein
MQPTDTNHTGVESHDHSPFGYWTEYHDAMEALNNLVHRLGREEADVNQSEWLRIAEQMAATLSYAHSAGDPRNG